MRTPAHALPALLSLSAIACGGDGTIKIELYFVDQLVEAPAARADLRGVKDVDCQTLLSMQHDQVGTAGQLVYQASEGWPVAPDSKIFEQIPHATQVGLDVAVYDDTDLQIARACMNLNVPKGSDEMLRIEMRPLPACENGPTSLDITIVLDTSTMMEVVDTELLHLTELVPRVIESPSPAFPADTRWSIVTYGGTVGASEVLAPTADVALVSSTIDLLRQGHAGPARLFDGVYLATGLLRGRAVCGRRPAQLILAGSINVESTRLREDASIGIIGTQGDATDDIYTYGIAFSSSSFDEIAELIPEEIGVATGAVTRSLRINALSNAGRELRLLVP